MLDHLCCVNSEAVAKAPSAGLRAGELPVVSNLVCEFDRNEASGKRSGQPRQLGPKSLSDLCTSQPHRNHGARVAPPAIASGGKVRITGTHALHREPAKSAHPPPVAASEYVRAFVTFEVIDPAERKSGRFRLHLLSCRLHCRTCRAAPRAELSPGSTSSVVPVVQRIA